MMSPFPHFTATTISRKCWTLSGPMTMFSCGMGRKWFTISLAPTLIIKHLRFRWALRVTRTFKMTTYFADTYQRARKKKNISFSSSLTSYHHGTRPIPLTVHNNLLIVAVMLGTVFPSRAYLNSIGGGMTNAGRQSQPLNTLQAMKLVRHSSTNASRQRKHILLKKSKTWLNHVSPGRVRCGLNNVPCPKYHRLGITTWFLTILTKCSIKCTLNLLSPRHYQQNLTSLMNFHNVPPNHGPPFLRSN